MEYGRGGITGARVILMFISPHQSKQYWQLPPFIKQITISPFPLPYFLQYLHPRRNLI